MVPHRQIAVRYLQILRLLIHNPVSTSPRKHHAAASSQPCFNFPEERPCCGWFTQVLHRLWRRICKLLAAQFSKEQSRHREFMERPATSRARHGEHQRKDSILTAWNAGKSSVLSGSAPVALVLNFLTQLYKTGLRNRTINTAHSGH